MHSRNTVLAAFAAALLVGAACSDRMLESTIVAPDLAAFDAGTNPYEAYRAMCAARAASTDSGSGQTEASASGSATASGSASTYEDSGGSGGAEGESCADLPPSPNDPNTVTFPDPPVK